MHEQLTGEKVLGIGDASGMFPIDGDTGGYHATMLARFDQLAAEAGVELTLAELLPAIAVAGRPAGTLSEAGAALLDPTGRLRPGIPLCPPEGDAGTGMVATNSVAPRTGNVSAGTSIFAMVVLERELDRVHRELDLVTTPAGDPVAMVHCNNGASELDAWAGLFAEFARALGSEVDTSKVFETLFAAALGGASDCGGMLAYNYLSGEPITDLEEGRPLFLRSPDSRLSLSTFMRTHLFSSLATLRIGMDVLQKTEGVRLMRMFAHGGLFKTAGRGATLPGRCDRHPGLRRRRRWRRGAPGGSPSWPPSPPDARRNRAWRTTWTPRSSPARACRPSSPTRSTSRASTRSCSGTSPHSRSSGPPWTTWASAAACPSEEDGMTAT